ncbi:hypothetical protein [Salinibacterium sp. SWN1162]|uniref:hypothetical protein n=1 Tax=Salinibacterium sp. SWN1162 TaxID=2792053 RepID=UPI0018CF236F|nr:hypothetical protein [Salinibacterium sp. SWN1162]MBH0010121.1 hypothetical protein [Salinibacterium sp. SWN1162]
MVDDVENLVNKFIAEGLPANIEDLSQAEQISLSKSLLHQVDSRVRKQRANSGELDKGHSYRLPSLELPHLIGEVVIAAAWAEDAAGTLIQAGSGTYERRAKGYDDTSSSLLKALQGVAPDELRVRFKLALELRHFVVHGFFTNGESHINSKTGSPHQFLAMKRSFRTQAPEREIMGFSAESLRELAQEFWEIESALEDLHTDIVSRAPNE